MERITTMRDSSFIAVGDKNKRKEMDWEDRVYFSVIIGNIGQESIDSTEILFSPQLRKISTSSQIYIPFFIVPQNTIFRIKHFNWDIYCGQAKQDLIVKLLVSGEYKFESAKLSSYSKGVPVISPPFDPPIIIQETRSLAEPGAPLTSITSLSNVGFPDNFIPSNKEFFSIAFENELIACKIINQSDVYDHWIKTELSGWTFPIKGRSRKDIFESLSS